MNGSFSSKRKNTDTCQNCGQVTENFYIWIQNEKEAHVKANKSILELNKENFSAGSALKSGCGEGRKNIKKEALSTYCFKRLNGFLKHWESYFGINLSNSDMLVFKQCLYSSISIVRVTDNKVQSNKPRVTR